MPVIRPARIEDAAAIARVHVESWKTTYAGIVPDSYLASLTAESRADSWKQQLEKQTALIFVAEDEAGVFGFVCGGALRDSIPGFDAELYAIYLLQQKQRRGIGRMLVRKLVEVLDREDFHGLIIWVLEQNPSAGFYAHLGGAPVLEKEIEIGGAQLTEIAFGWPDIRGLLDNRTA
jgi:L-amino acid N-acyltransferase YncA